MMNNILLLLYSVPAHQASQLSIQEKALFSSAELIHHSTCWTFAFHVSPILCLEYSKNQQVHSSLVIFTSLDGLSQVTDTSCHKSPPLLLPFVMYVTLYTYRKLLWPHWLLQGNDKVIGNDRYPLVLGYSSILSVTACECVPYDCK